MKIFSVELHSAETDGTRAPMPEDMERSQLWMGYQKCENFLRRVRRLNRQRLDCRVEPCKQHFNLGNAGIIQEYFRGLEGKALIYITIHSFTRLFETDRVRFGNTHFR